MTLKPATVSKKMFKIIAQKTAILLLLLSLNFSLFHSQASPTFAVGTCFGNEKDNWNNAIVEAKPTNENNYIANPIEIAVTFNMKDLPKGQKYKIIVSNSLSTSLTDYFFKIFADDAYSDEITYDQIEKNGAKNINDQKLVTYTFTTTTQSSRPGKHEVKFAANNSVVCNKLHFIELFDKNLRNLSCSVRLDHTENEYGKAFNTYLSVINPNDKYVYSYYIIKTPLNQIPLSPRFGDNDWLRNITKNNVYYKQFTPTQANPSVTINNKNDGSFGYPKLTNGTYSAIIKVAVLDGGFGTFQKGYGFFCAGVEFKINNSPDSKSPPAQSTSLPTSGVAAPVTNPNQGVGQSKPPASPIPATGKPCGKDNTGVLTAIGCISTDPVGLVKDFFKLAVGIGGGIALLLMIAGAFQMIASAGNPESIKEGKERFTNAIIGLLFVVFSILLLRIIGVDILGLGQFLGVTQ